MFSSVAANDSDALRWRTRRCTNCKQLETRRRDDFESASAAVCRSDESITWHLIHVLEKLAGR